MSTLGPTAIKLAQASDAEFRAWCQFIHDTLALAWVQTADAGQINLATVAKPAGANAKQGYEIWRMDDALQATAPIYLRIDYGSGGAAGWPGIWLTLGKGSNGAGTITTLLMDGGGVAGPTIGSTGLAAAKNAYGSADLSRVTLILPGTDASPIGFGIERTKDSAGGDTDVGLLVTLLSYSLVVTKPANLSGSANATGTVYLYLLNTGAQPPFAPGWQFILCNQNPSVFASDVGIGAPIPLGTVAKQPGVNWGVCRTNDFLLEATPSITVYGNAVTYVRCTASAYIGNSVAATLDNVSAVLMRFD